MPSHNSGYTKSHLHLQTGSSVSIPSKQCYRCEGLFTQARELRKASTERLFLHLCHTEGPSSRSPASRGDSCPWFAPCRATTMTTITSTLPVVCQPCFFFPSSLRAVERPGVPRANIQQGPELAVAALRLP